MYIHFFDIRRTDFTRLSAQTPEPVAAAPDGLAPRRASATPCRPRAARGRRGARPWWMVRGQRGMRPEASAALFPCGRGQRARPRATRASATTVLRPQWRPPCKAPSRGVTAALGDTAAARRGDGGVSRAAAMGPKRSHPASGTPRAAARRKARRPTPTRCIEHSTAEAPRHAALARPRSPRGSPQARRTRSCGTQKGRAARYAVSACR